MMIRPHRNIFLVEGPIGAGKTSLAMRLAQDLEAKGIEARAFLEFDADHPIRTEQVDELSGREVDPKGYGREPWARLAAQCVVNRGAALIDATLIQNTLLPAFAACAPQDYICQLAQERMQALAPARPLIVYLHVDDIEAHLQHLHRTRPAAWSAQNLAWINETEWAKAHALAGLPALITFHKAWQTWVETWLAQQGQKSLVLAAQRAEIATLSQLVLNHAAKPS